MVEMPANSQRTWLTAGHEVFPAMLEAIEFARLSVCFETYIFTTGKLGARFREALVAASGRGVRVRILLDSLGSLGMAATFWDPLRSAGGEVKFFNPLSLNRLGIRDHRKVLVCDSQVAFVGGFNVSDVYDGDGVSSGWRDLGLRLQGPIAAELEASFEEMFAKADFRHKRFVRLRRTTAKKTVLALDEQLLLSGPGRGSSPIKRALRKDLKTASDVKVVMAYFLPTWRIRQDFTRVVRNGGNVELILAGKSDVLLSQLAGQSLYRRLLRGGVYIFEYQPQVLHAKLIIVDEAVYVGSSNLDQRSLNINYELMVRFQDAALAQQAREVFSSMQVHCRPVTLESWKKRQTLWGQLKQHLAYTLLVRLDPHVALSQWHGLPE